MLHRIIMPLTVAADGTGTVTADSAVTGFLWGVEYVKNNYDNGVDATIGVSGSAETDAILTISNFTASARWFPRGDAVNTSGTIATGAGDCLIPIAGKPYITLAQAGNATTGTFILWWID